MDANGVARLKLASSQDSAFITRIGNLLKNGGTLLKILLKGLWEVVKATAKGLVNLFRTAPGEYITFIIFIIILLTGIMFLAFSPNSPFRSGGGGGGGGGAGGDGSGSGGILTDYLAKFNVDTSWLYKFRGKDGNNLALKDRPKLLDGRCNGITNIDVSTNTLKSCLNAKLPATIEWNLDPTLMPEWKQLPPRIQARLAKAKNGTKVYIPWGIAENPADANNPFAKLKKKETPLVPQCSKAYYGDGTSAADLFRNDEETNDKCRLAVVKNNSYGERGIPYDDERPGRKTPANRGDNKTCTL